MHYPIDMTYLSLALCFIPLVALYLCLALLVQGFKKLTGLWACVLGLLALIPAEIFLMFVGNKLPGVTLPNRLMKYILLALIEEGIKMLLLFLLPSKKTPLHVFLSYALLCGMALGCFEAFIYVVERHVVWRYAATLIHIFCCGLSGMFVYSVRKKSLHITPFVFAVLFHGVYNYFAGFPDFRHYFAFAVIVIAILECRLRYAFLKDDIEKLSVIGNDNNIVEKGENLKMGFKDFKDFIKGLFGGKQENAEPSLPEKTVFGKDADATVAAESAASEAVEAVEDTVSSAADEVVKASSEFVEETKAEFSQYPVVDKLFDDEAPQDDVEPKTDLFSSDITTSDLDKKISPILTDSVKSSKDDKSEEEKKPATRKRASAKSASSSTATKTPAKRGRKPAAEKAAASTATTPAKRGRKPAAEKAVATATTPAKRGRKPAAEKAAAATTATPAKRGRKPSVKTEETKTTASKAKSTTKAASATKKATAKAESTATKAKTPAKKTTATKTSKAASSTTKKAAAEKKPAAKKTTTAKKTTSTSKKKS